MKTFKRFFTLIKLAYQHRLIAHLINYAFKKKHFKQEKNITQFAQNLHQFLENAGPIFTKLGQNLSIHAHIIHPTIIKQLEKLQDNCAPIPISYIQKILEKAYGKNWEQTFQSFNPTPLACASIAQVHTAKLNNKPVILKILRPSIDQKIQQDIKIIFTFISTLQLIAPKLKRLKLTAIIKLFKNILRQETNLMVEAANAGQLKRQQNKNTVNIPAINWQYSTKNILVQQRFFGQSIKKAWHNNFTGTSVEKNTLAKNILQTLLIQIFEHNFFHADMHPGNLLIDQAGQYMLVDFGIVDSISPHNQHYIALNFIAFLEGDYQAFTRLHIQAGWLSQSVDAKAFENAIRLIFEPLIHQPKNHLNIGKMLMDLFNIAHQFNINIQPELVLMQRALMNTENIAKQIDPNIDTWSIIQPFFKKWIRQNSPQSSCHHLPKKMKTTLTGLYALHNQLKNHAPLLQTTKPPIPSDQKYKALITCLVIIIVIQLIDN